MKKILLFLFLFTSFPFYSQISDLPSDCNTTNYNLTHQYDSLTNFLNPKETAISYHLSLSDANNGINPITNPESYNSSEYNQIIYARINNAGVISVKYFTLFFSYLSVPLQIKSASELGKNDGEVSFTIIGESHNFKVALDGLSHSYEGKTHEDIYGVFHDLSPGRHSISISTPFNCSVMYAFDIAESPLNFTTTVIDKTITVHATGGIPPYSYKIDNKNYNSNNIFSELSIGSHTVEVIDSNIYEVSGLLTKKVIIEGPDLLKMTVSFTNINCFGDNNGSITVNANGSYPPYTYSIDGSSYTESNIFNNLVAGTYITYVKDADGTIVSNVATVEQPATPISITITTKDVGCTNNGSITITTTGGQAPYTYSKDGINYDSHNVFSDLRADTYTLYVKDSNGCISKDDVTLYRLMIPKPFSLSVRNVSCNGGNDGKITLNFMDTTGSYTYKINGDIAINGNTFSGLSVGTYRVAAINSNSDCYSYAEDIVITEPAILSATTTVESQNITITATGGNSLYEYGLDGGQFQSSNIFDNAFYGVHEISVRDLNGCEVVMSVSINPPAPLVDGKNATIVEFKSGQTLEDLVVDGQNIKWYNNNGNTLKKTNKSSEATLPLTTLLVDGTTYYASQTINETESKERLAVTVKLSGSLSNPDFVLPNFKYYPNPVQHTLTIDNSATIDEIEILSVSGKSILTKKINNTHSEIDLSNVSSGFYFLKVKAEGQVKTIKIVKK